MVCPDENSEFIPGEGRVTGGVTIHLVEASCNTGISIHALHITLERKLPVLYILNRAVCIDIIAVNLVLD